MKELTVPALVENLPTVTDFVDGVLESIGCPMKVQFQIDVVIDEIFSNICFYAYAPETGDATVQIDADEEKRCITLRFSDRGKPFNPLNGADPDISLNLEDRESGGLGVFLVKKSMDDVSYDYRDGKNILTMKKMM